MPLVTLSDRELAEIDRGLDELKLPSPDEIRALISEVRGHRRVCPGRVSSQLRLAAALRTVQTTAETTLQMEAAR